jgi:hypothetical protein
MLAIQSKRHEMIDFLLSENVDLTLRDTFTA